ncbi:DUF4390 domain-containing protein [uncultured Hydrogenophaga sp.]|uniref:DUF4390 domain-containing protein n=1 Tax=uncultured Hydrogenophaga sp. TaxID=199683 RepID=UPI00265F728A|nr:DUF4390 domain-containing protein [uncultured Hydrogenophaga sp.]
MTVSSTPGSTSPLPEGGRAFNRAWHAAGRRVWAAVGTLMLGLCLLADARANPQVQQMALERTAEGLYLNARLGLSATPVVEDALVRGVPLYFVWQVDVTRSRWYWADKRLISAVRVLRLAYQPLTRRWRVSLSTDSGAAGGGAGLQYAAHQNHDSLADALASIGRPGRWRLLDATQIEPGETHRAEVAFRLDLSLLPRPFQIGLGNDPDWTVQFLQRLTVPDAIEPDR